MADKSNIFQIEYYIDLVLKRRWLLILPLCLALMGGLYLSFVLPKIYEANTLIVIMPQRVPEDYVRSVVSGSVESRINTISEEILSRSNLEKIIQKFGLFSNSEAGGMFMEDMVDNLRQRIEVSVQNPKGRGSAEAFSISFQGPEPELVMKVTNELAGSFIQENLRERESQAVGTSDFLADELESTRKRLQASEQKIIAYRQQYIGELPEQMDANLRILDGLQNQLNERKKSLSDEKYRLSMLDSQIEDQRKILAEGGETSLDQLKGKLAAMKLNYTENHPDIIRLKDQIAKLENPSSADGQVKSNAESGIDKSVPATSENLKKLLRSRMDMVRDIENIESDIVQINRDIEIYKERVERTPKREEELLSLNRDYKNVQDSYKSLLDRRLEAEISVNMEKKQKGEQFRIIDYASLPQKPVSPDFRKLLLMSVAAGLGVGAGLIILLDFLNTSLKNPKEYESELGMKVLATIPKMVTSRQKVWRRLNAALTFVSLLFIFGLAGVFGVMIVQGVDPVLKIVGPYL